MRLRHPICVCLLCLSGCSTDVLQHSPSFSLLLMSLFKKKEPMSGGEARRCVCDCLSLLCLFHETRTPLMASQQIGGTWENSSLTNSLMNIYKKHTYIHTPAHKFVNEGRWCCSVLPCVAVCCSALKWAYLRGVGAGDWSWSESLAMRCRTLSTWVRNSAPSRTPIYT